MCSSTCVTVRRGEAGRCRAIILWHGSGRQPEARSLSPGTNAHKDITTSTHRINERAGAFFIKHAIASTRTIPRPYIFSSVNPTQASPCSLFFTLHRYPNLVTKGDICHQLGNIYCSCYHFDHVGGCAYLADAPKDPIAEEEASRN